MQFLYFSMAASQGDGYLYSEIVTVYCLVKADYDTNSSRGGSDDGRYGNRNGRRGESRNRDRNGSGRKDRSGYRKGSGSEHRRRGRHLGRQLRGQTWS